MFQALQQNPTRQRVSTMRTVPAPVKGWNQRARSQEAGVEYAFELQNFIPEIGRVTVRNGSEAHADGVGAAVETLIEYTGGNANKLFAAGNSAIYDVTSAGTVGAAAVSSLTNDRWEYINFSNSGGNYALLVNGADGVRSYDGTTWATQTITGVTAADLDHICAHKERVWFIEKNTLSAWYLAVNAISGAATEYPLGSVFQRGGHLVSAQSWSRDGGAGMDDFLVWITSEGEVAIYQGTDPSAASTWALVGVFQIDKPIGQRCMINVGADLAVLTESGLYPLSRVLAAPSPQQIVPEEVRDAFLLAADDRKNVWGWQLVNYKQRGWLFANIPLDTGADQYCLNTVTNRWFKISDWDAQCWGTLSGELYYGDSSGNVVKADSSAADQGNVIVARIVTGWDNFGSDVLKKFKMLKPLASASSDFNFLAEILIDYDLTGSGAEAEQTLADEGATWDVAEWDVADWISTAESRNIWRGVTGIGSVGAILFEVRLKNVELSVSGFDVMWEQAHGYI